MLPVTAMVLLGWTLLMSFIAAVAVLWDKRQACRGGWRVRENTLHLWELLGGWPGSLVTRHVVRHKTRDRRYRIKAAAIISLHVVVWVILGLLLLQSQ